jgi:hypothetical protein
MSTGRAWAKVANAALQMGVAVVGGNPLPAVTGAVSFVGWLYDIRQRADRGDSPSERPTRSVSEQLDAIAERQDLRESWSSSVPTDDPATRTAIEDRAREIAMSPEAGSDFDNWLRAVTEAGIAERAREIAASPEGGSDFDNWLRAERELKVAERAREIAASEEGGSDFDNWVRAERDWRIAERARAIAASPDAGTDVENWLRAEEELENEHELIAERAREISASPEAGSDEDHWLRAEGELRAAGRIRNW